MIQDSYPIRAENSSIGANSGLIIQVRLPADQNPAAVYLAGLSDGSKPTMRHALNRIAELLTGTADCLSLDWSRVRFQHTAAIRAKLGESLKAKTTNKYLCALRGALKAAWRLGLMTAENYQQAAAVESVKGSTILAGRELTAGELAALMANCENDSSPAGVRDAAIVATLYAAGLRRHEITRLELANYNPEKSRLFVLGKRNKERTVYLTDGAAAALDDWLAIRGSEAGTIFWRITSKGILRPGRLSSQAIYNLLVKRARLAGLRPFSPHDLRRTFISDLLDAGADIATVAKLAGHASVITTQGYDRRPEETKQKAAGLLHVPYNKRCKDDQVDENGQRRHMTP